MFPIDAYAIDTNTGKRKKLLNQNEIKQQEKKLKGLRIIY